MSTQHTPTPWHVAKDDPAAIFNSMGGYVTRIDGNAVQTRAAIEGNAAFIVRACNAHDELVAALAQIARLSAEGEVSANMQYALGDIARAALAKVA